jgi:hypothetical protein
MPKRKVNGILIDTHEELVDATTMGVQLGFTGAYISRMAAAGKIPWHGICNGAKVYRRFNPYEVKAALAHPVQEIEKAKTSAGSTRNTKTGENSRSDSEFSLLSIMRRADEAMTKPYGKIHAIKQHLREVRANVVELVMTRNQ